MADELAALGGTVECHYDISYFHQCILSRHPIACLALVGKTSYGVSCEFKSDLYAVPCILAVHSIVLNWTVF